MVIESEHFETIGFSEDTQIGEFVTLQTIWISGQIKEKSTGGNTIILTNGNLLELNNGSKFEKVANFKDRVKMYF